MAETSKICRDVSSCRVDSDQSSPNNSRCPSCANCHKFRSFYGVTPVCKFGPKGGIVEHKDALQQIPDPASQRLQWTKPPTSVLVVLKVYDSDIVAPFCELVTWLIQEHNMHVYIETRVMYDPDMKRIKKDLASCSQKLHSIKEGDDITDKVDLIICLGGDGTLLHASSLFQRSVPPVMAFHFGSIGFLAPFDFTNFRHEVTDVLKGNVNLTLRSRLKCIVRKNVVPNHKVLNHSKITDNPPIENGLKVDQNNSRILVLNEVVIERGHSSFLTYIDLYIERRLVTSVQGDGLIIATPTGSTAYSLAAGASMVHPSVPGIVITPICPHSLSFRPIIVPAGVDIKVMLSPDSRNSAWVSFDGRNRQELNIGESINITTAAYPVPHVRKKDRIDDWFDSLAECLHWNVRKPQRTLSATSIRSDRSRDNSLHSDDSSMHSIGEVEND